MPPASLRFAAAAAALMACGCGTNQPASTPPDPIVEVITVQNRAVPNIIELPGRIEAVRSAEVRARTDGIVQRRLYREGTDVPAGAPLFQIDLRDKRAQLEQAQAALARAGAARHNAAQIVARYRPLVSERAVSALESDRALSDLSQAEASVADARAAVSRAQLELSYTTVRAPISGRVGRALVTEGALVSAGGATLMTTVEQLTPVYASFTQSSAELQTLMDQARSGQLAPQPLHSIEVRLTLQNGRQYGPVGHLDFADLSVDPSTGSQMLRATFPNPNRILLPGQFVRGRINAGTFRDGIIVPQRAVQISDNAATVVTVSRNGIATICTVALGAQIEGDWIILSGLSAGQRIIVEGWQKVRNGQRVQARSARNRL